MTDKEQVIKLIRALPDDATFEEILYRCYVVARVREGEQAIREGRVVPHENVKKMFLSKGPKASGRD
jgi:predicted transcriptional regulator